MALRPAAGSQEICYCSAVSLGDSKSITGYCTVTRCPSACVGIVRPHHGPVSRGGQVSDWEVEGSNWGSPSVSCQASSKFLGSHESNSIGEHWQQASMKGCSQRLLKGTSQVV